MEWEAEMCGPSGHEPCAHDFDPPRETERRRLRGGIWSNDMKTRREYDYEMVTEQRLCRACRAIQERRTCMDGQWSAWRVPDRSSYAVLDGIALGG